MDANLFVNELKAHVDAHLAGLSETETLTFETRGSLEIPVLLRAALRNEMEATLVAANWLASVADHTPHTTSMRLALARQVGDESRHYTLVAARLRQLDVDVGEDDVLKEPARSPLTAWLLGLVDPVERMAAGPFAREALACVKNQQFIRLCRARGDVHTAALYERTILPDELHHHALGDRFLRRHCTTEAAQAAARAAVEKTLTLADEMAHRARERGAVRAPGC